MKDNKNKAKYLLIDTSPDRNLIAIVYEHGQYGRTLVLEGKVDPQYDLELRNPDGSLVGEFSLIEFIHSMVPGTQ